MRGEVGVHHCEITINDGHQVLGEGAVNGVGDEFFVTLMRVPVCLVQIWLATRLNHVENLGNALKR